MGLVLSGQLLEGRKALELLGELLDCSNRAREVASGRFPKDSGSVMGLPKYLKPYHPPAFQNIFESKVSGFNVCPPPLNTEPLAI